MPEIQRLQVLRLDHPLAGHFGTQKTIELLHLSGSLNGSLIVKIMLRTALSAIVIRVTWLNLGDC